MNIDSGVGLIGTIVFPEGELVTWNHLGDIWRPITAAALMVTWFRCTSECFLIHQRRSPAINIALSAETGKDIAALNWQRQTKASFPKALYCNEAEILNSTSLSLIHRITFGYDNHLDTNEQRANSGD